MISIENITAIKSVATGGSCHDVAMRTVTESHEKDNSALSDLFHHYLTGVLLTLLSEKDEDCAAEVVHALFRRQHHEKFMPGLHKLGLAQESHAVACAKYHYLSNHLGGVSVAFVAESEKKAWVRYLPPRWIFDGTALASVPTKVARAMLHGWHGHNGVSLGNRRLGFVCTGQTMDGFPGLEGYYIEEDYELDPDQRLRFRFGEQCPPIDYGSLPQLSSEEWPRERKAKASRKYSMEYIRNLLPVLSEVLGPLQAQGILYRAGRRIGMQFSAETQKTLGTNDPIKMLASLFSAQGDRITIVGTRIQQDGWRLVAGLEEECVPEWMDGLAGLWEGLIAVADSRRRLVLGDRMDLGDNSFTWDLRHVAEPKTF